MRVSDEAAVVAAGRAALANSSDPHTRTAVVLTRGGSLLSSHANRLPRGAAPIPNRLTRPEKYEFIGHAEQRAVAWAAREGVALRGAEMWLFSDRRFLPCSTCARLIVDAGILRVHLQYELRDVDKRDEERYGFQAALAIVSEGGVALTTPSMRWAAAGPLAAALAQEARINRDGGVG